MDYIFRCYKSLLVSVILLLLSDVSNGTLTKPRTEDFVNASHPVPYGHIPYHPSLPGAMGPVWSFPCEWWFYCGWAQSASQTGGHPGPKFTLYLHTTRVTLDAKNRYRSTQVIVSYGIGLTTTTDTTYDTSSTFLSNYSVASGFYFKKSPGQQLGLTIPPPTEDQWYCEGRTTTMQMTAQLTDGILGLAGASYKLEMVDTSQDLKAVFKLYDPFGGILEYSTTVTPTYEFALPSLNIMKGSYITLNDVKYNLVDGNLWLDRQTSLYVPISGSNQKSKLFPLHNQLTAGSALYTGTWLAIVMNDKTVYEMIFNWTIKEDQWIVGDKLDPPYPPVNKLGVKYPYKSEWMNWIGMPAMQGVSVLDWDEFDLNIFDPNNPSLSPHWKSPISNQTYCTKWQLKMVKEYVLTALIPESEIKCGKDYYFEGIAIISDPNDPSNQPVGHVFVEQMGFTQ